MTYLPLSLNQNRLLASISQDSYARLALYLELVHVRRGQTLYSHVGAVNYVYFPTTAIISIFADTPEGASAEVALIGNDGTLGLMSALCGARAPLRGVVDTAGAVFRIGMEYVQTELKRGESLQRVLMRHLTARMTMIAGNALCNSQHSVEQRFCRALLMRLERTDTGMLTVTHEMMANVLGTRRAGVTRAAADLKRSGVIAYTRGRVAVVDAKLLQERACECYGLLKSQIERFYDPGEAPPTKTRASR